MAIQFVDSGGELYFSSGITAAGIWSSTNGVTLVNNAPAGRATSYGIFMNNATSPFIIKTLTTGFASLVVGTAIYIPANFFNSTATPLVRLLDSGTNQCDVRVTINGALEVTRNGTVLGTSTLQLVNGSGWHYIEAALVVDNTVGTAQVWVDNVSWLSLTGLDTQNTSNASANGVGFYLGNTGQANPYYKDIYILDTGTGVNTARLGDITVAVTFPNGAGVNSAWTANTGTALAAVQDGITHTGTWPDGDTTYILDSNTNDISDFAHQTLTLTGVIYGVVHMSYMRKDDAGARSVAQVCISNSTVETGSTISLGNSYTYFQDVIENDPHTSAPWTLSGYNASTYGVKEVS